MNVKEFNEKYGPEWQLTVFTDKVTLENIVPLYMMTIPMAEWSLETFTKGIPVPRKMASQIYEHWDEEDREWPDYDSVEVHEEAFKVVSRVRYLKIRSDSWNPSERIFDVSTNEKLDAASIAALKWMWEDNKFPKLIPPPKPGYMLSEVLANPSIPEALKDIAKKEWEAYVEKRQSFDKDERVYKDVKKTVESGNGGGAWVILHSLGMGAVDFLE